ncbi:MAG TPA: hypothetical protein VGO37_06330 [Steroidobacteraceae bacterium]|jgi:hypothetical protein|nr:hypothetical protein [Steroidobacteraceae bacterium]
MSITKSAVDKQSGLAAGALILGMIFLPRVSTAGEPAPDARTLGVAESIVSYCTRVDPPSAVKLQEKVQELLKGVAGAAVAELRKSKEYKAGYAELTAYVGTVDQQNAAAPCTMAVSEPKAEAP